MKARHALIILTLIGTLLTVIGVITLTQSLYGNTEWNTPLKIITGSLILAIGVHIMLTGAISMKNITKNKAGERGAPT